MIKKDILRFGGIVILILIFVGIIYYINEIAPNRTSVKGDNFINGICEDCNVILVTLDTTRADHLSSYGYDRDTTKMIQDLSKKGVVFENAFVQMPYTPTSHWSILSGTYPHTHKHFSPGIPVDQGGPDDTELPFIAKILNNDGYATMALMGSKMVHSLVPGFDIVDLTPAAGRNNTSAIVTDKAIEWITDNQERKFFTWIHYWDPHDPYKPPAEYVYPDNPDEEFDKFVYMQRRYDGEIKHVDHQFGRVLDHLESLEIDKKTVIVITADHGESFGEYEKGLFFPNNMKQLTRGHYQTVYDQEIHVPLIIYNPVSAHANERFDTLVQSIDIVPTILDMLDVPIPNDIEGNSLKPVIDGTSERVNDYIFSILKYVPNELFENKNNQKNSVQKVERGLRATLRTDKWKLIRFANKKNGVEEIAYVLYDLDKGESTDVSEEHQDIKNDMIEQLELMIKGGNITNDEVELTEEEIRILKSLGYIK